MAKPIVNLNEYNSEWENQCEYERKKIIEAIEVK
jgi:hypothetical protein